MCANYIPVTQTDRLLAWFGVQRERDEPPHDTFPLGLAPFIRLAPSGDGTGEPARVAEDGVFGLLPHFARDLQYGRKTYNARSETVAELHSYKLAWARGQRCIIPAEAIYEPSYETGKPVRWRIALPQGVPMGIAGIWWEWTQPDGRRLFSFSMLTVNATDHPVMQRFHKPEEEKRMVVIMDPADYDAWLSCSVEESRRYIRRWERPLEATEAPLPPRAPRAVSGRVIARTPPPPPPTTGSLFE